MTFTIKAPRVIMKAMRNVTLVAGVNVLDFTTLREGDCSDDGQVNAIDFSVLAGSYLKSTGHASFDDRADFDRTGQVNALDFSLLASNYLRNEPETCP